MGVLPGGSTDPTHSLSGHEQSERRAPESLGERVGDSVGPYRLLQLIGEGGFGVVWLAERREPMVQRVALKIIKPGMDSKSVIARFEQERQALAVMDHPSVAKVFDGGMTPSGRPYFVMEYVPGEPITQFCDRHTYTLQQRLSLMIRVCDAVQHAHTKGIIHRDLKPSNILVAIKDGEAQPKVIDFGVAKAISHLLTEKTIFTEWGVLIGTPEYMSPEQASVGAHDIDTRSDVYSLGVLLYELLVGLTPFDGAAMRSKGYEEIQRIIRETDPPHPSTRLSSARSDLDAIARLRHTDPGALGRAVSGELGWIVMRCLERERSRRYETPSELAKDIERHLRDEPVLARPQSVVYQLGKFARRHRAPLAAAAAVLAALASGLAFMSVGFVRARSERNAAIAARTEAEQARSELSDQLALTQRVNDLIQSSLLREQSLDVGADELYERIVREAESVFGPRDPKVAALLTSAGSMLSADMVRSVDGQDLLLRAIEYQQASLGSDNASVAIPLGVLASIKVTSTPALSIEFARRALAVHERSPGPDSLEAAVSRYRLAVILITMNAMGGKPDPYATEAKTLLTEAIATFDRVGRGNDVIAVQSRMVLGQALYSLRRTDEAIETM